jgi:hypothetical protein
MGDQHNQTFATVVVRSTGAVVFWLVASAVALAGLYWLRDVEPWRGVVALIGVFCAQVFFAEAVGYRVGRTGVSFPRRLFPPFPFPVFWRRRIPEKSISRVDALGDRAALFYLTSTERVPLLFPDHQSRRVFLRHLDHSLELGRIARSHAVDRTLSSKSATRASASDQGASFLP